MMLHAGLALAAYVHLVAASAINQPAASAAGLASWPDQTCPSHVGHTLAPVAAKLVLLGGKI